MLNNHAKLNHVNFPRLCNKQENSTRTGNKQIALKTVLPANFIFWASTFEHLLPALKPDGRQAILLAFLCEYERQTLL